MILLDTNVLVYALNSASTRHSDCRQVVDRAVAGRLPAVLVPQVLIECYSVITSPRRMPRPLSPDQARTTLRSLGRAIEVRAVPATLLDDLDLTLSRHPQRGRDIFDLVLVAQMQSHGIRTICTCNTADFTLPGVQPVDPTQALAAFA